MPQQSKRQIGSIKTAVKYYCKEIRGEKPKTVASRNEGRHRFIEFDNENVRLMHKSDLFQKFSDPEYYGHLPYDCKGGGINLEELAKAQGHQVTKLVTVLEDGRVFEIGVGKAMKFAQDHDTIRETKSGEKIVNYPVDEMDQLA